MSKLTVIESDDYRKEVEILKADPIVLAMVKDLPPDITREEMDSWVFMSAASQEYQSRKGTNARSIGGPARAIKALVIESRKTDPLDFIMAYEAGELDKDEIVEGFQNLIDTGVVWQLQGSYGRMAVALIEAGLCHGDEHN